MSDTVKIRDANEIRCSHFGHHDQSGSARVFSPPFVEQFVGYLLRVDDNKRAGEKLDNHEITCTTTVNERSEWSKTGGPPYFFAHSENVLA